jgi:hypothetical protein
MESSVVSIWTLDDVLALLVALPRAQMSRTAQLAVV